MSQVRNKERGASLVEYALLIALIAVVATASMRLLGVRVAQRLTFAGQEIEAAGTWMPTP